MQVTPGDPKAPILPRGGWDKLRHIILKVGSIPGPAATREQLMAGFAKPLWVWACPIVAPAPNETPKLIMRAVLRSACTWWCFGRWWAARVELHPHYSYLLQMVKQITNPLLTWSDYVENAVVLTLNKCLLGYNGFSRTPGQGISINIRSDDDPKILRATASLRGSGDHFWTDSAAAQHALRVICRIRALSHASPSRWDYQGIDDVDVEASSSKLWKDFVKKLSGPQRTALTIYRGGATSTQTRRRDGQACIFCNHAFPSLRHLWAECPRYRPQRIALAGSVQPRIPAYWWRRQPRVTAKSDWITYNASPNNPQRRAQLQIATCQLGMAIIQEGLQSNRLS